MTNIGAGGRFMPFRTPVQQMLVPAHQSAFVLRDPARIVFAAVQTKLNTFHLLLSDRVAFAEPVTHQGGTVELVALPGAMLAAQMESLSVLAAHLGQTS